MARGSFSPWRWLASLTWGSFWALPTLLLMASILVAGLFLWADAEGLSIWLYAQGWPLAMAGGTAQELASVLVGVHAAFLTLYFSITLLVLTLAASNLGVRLIDRWIAKEMTRWTLGFLLGGFGWAVLVLWAVDPDATGPEVARGSLTALLGYTLFLTAWLAGALHDLGRTIHIDIDIAEIGTEGKERQDYFQNVAAAPHPGFDGTVFYAPKDGYIEGVDFRALVKLVEKAGQRMQLDMGVGRYVMAGEPLGRFETGSDQGEAAAKLFSFGRFRAGAQGVVFDARLLVEVAARALSPAINDFYTGIACCDRLGTMIAAQARLARPPGWLADRLYIADHSFEGLFGGPMAGLRQAAADYPSVSIRMIDMLGRADGDDLAPEERRCLRTWAQQLADHAAMRAQVETDRRDIARRLAKAFPGASVAERPPSP